MMNKLCLSSEANYVISRLERAGYEAYAVGGCVRDLCMNVTPNDYDITTSALPDKVCELFSDERVIPTGIKHGTVTVLVDGVPIEVTTYRIDGAYDDNRHPRSVEYTSDLSLDLSRRDFTVNAMAYSDRTGIIDLFCGEKHIKNKTICCVGEPKKRFDEDGLRILRALRFASVLRFGIESETQKAVHAQKSLLEGISRERILSEFTKLLCGGGVSDILNGYPDVTAQFVPGFKETDFSFMAALQSDRYTRFAAFFNTFCGADEASCILHALKSDGKLIYNVKALLETLKAPYGCDRLSAKKLLNRLGAENAYRLLEIREICLGDESAKPLRSEVDSVLAENECWSLKMLALNGNDLIEAGVGKQSEIGRTLESLLEAVMSGKVANDKAALLELTKINTD